MKKKKYYHYIIEILKPSGDVWFLATFDCKAKARLWLDGFRQGIAPMEKIEFAPKVGREFVKYFSFKPFNR